MATVSGGLRAGARGTSPGRIVALVVVLVTGGMLGWYGFKTAVGDGTTSTTPLQTTTVQPRSLQQTATTSGNIVALKNSKLTFANAGRLATLNVKQGQTVAAGDVIATLDATQLKITLDQAKSTLISAQAKLDALLAGATPDVSEAARAAIAQAKGSELTAESQLASARNSKTAATNAVGTAQNQVASAANSVTTAHSTVVTAESNLQTAQNNVQNLLNGPTPQDIAVSQAAVDSAQTSFATAQENYNRLINHTEIATRPETSALTTASAAYQQALAAQANAQPQPANPIDISSAQLQINTTQAQLALANQNTLTAAANLSTAQQTAAAAQVSTPGSVQCLPVGTSGLASCGPGDPVPPSAATTTANQNAVTAAQGQVSSTTSAVIVAQQAYQKALNDLQKLITPFTTQDLSGMQAQVDSAKQQLDVARRNYDSYINLPDLAIRPETAALDTARSGLNTAQAQYSLKVAPPKDTDLANAQAQIQTAQAALDGARAAEANASVAVSTAQLGVANAVATAANSDSAISAAAGSVDGASANITSAQKKLDQVVAPPLPTDVIQATEQVKQAQLAVDQAQYNLDNAVLRAPFGGVVALAAGNPGDQISAATTIAQIVDPNNIELDAQVDETTYGQVQVAMPVSVAFDSLPGDRITGFITTKVPSGTTTQGVVLFPIVITLTNQGTLPPNGASASQITVILKAIPNALSVPGNYLYRDAGGNQVVDVIKNGKRVPTKVVTGTVTTAATEIVSGLLAGDQIARPIARKGGTTSAVGAGGVPGLGGGGGGPGR